MPNPGCELGVGVAHAQVGQDQQCLAARRQAPPPRALPSMPRAQMAGEEAQSGAGQVDAAAVDKHVKPLVDPVLLVENPSTRRFSALSAQRASQSGRLEQAH